MYLFFIVLSALVYWRPVECDVGCSADELPCDSGTECINRTLWCNKDFNCADQSDEAYCKEGSWWYPDPNKCKKTHFLCPGGICFPKSAECDGFIDCEDKSDEIFCDNSVEASSDDPEESSSESDESKESQTEARRLSTTTIKNYKPSSERASTPKHQLEEMTSSTTTIKSHTEPPLSASPQLLSTTAGYYAIRLKEAASEGYEKTTIKSKSVSTKPTPTTSPPVVFRDINRTTVARAPTTKSAIPRSSTPYPVTRRHNNVTNHYSVSTNTSHGGPASRRRPPLIYNNRPSTYDNRPKGYGNRSYPNLQPRQYSQDHQPATYHNRGSHQSNARRTPNVLNGEPDWRHVGIRPYKRVTEGNVPFHFAKDYAELFGSDYTYSLQKGVKWLLGRKDNLGSWGRDTARTLTALVLANGSFSSGVEENELMKRNFMVQLGVELLRNETKFMTPNRLVMAMNALIAVCENPRDFNGMDLTEVLRGKIRNHFRGRDRPSMNPFVYLSLCLSGKSLQSSELQSLMKQMESSASSDERTKDMQSLAIQAFACHMHQNLPEDNTYRRSLQEILHNAVSNLLLRVGDDGSFGSVYSTALAAQALISVNDSGSWDVGKTLNFLKQQQQDDGSFGDILSTYYVLPTLGGRSLLHLRNTPCKPPNDVRDLTPREILDFAGPRHYVHYSIYFGYPLVNSYSVRVLVPQGISLLDVMRVAQYQDRNFRFLYEADDRNVYVYSVSGLPNNSEQGLSWHLYIKPDSDPNQKELNSGENQYNGDIRQLFPRSDQHVIFWYHANGP